MEELFNMKRKGHALRNYEPEDFREAFENAETLDERDEVRQALRQVDGGRWHSALDEMHNVVAHQDLAGRRAFCPNHPELMKWLSVFGMVENLNQFRDWTPEDW